MSAVASCTRVRRRLVDRPQCSRGGEEEEHNDQGHETTGEVHGVLDGRQLLRVVDRYGSEPVGEVDPERLFDPTHGFDRDLLARELRELDLPSEQLGRDARDRLQPLVDDRHEVQDHLPVRNDHGVALSPQRRDQLLVDVPVRLLPKHGEALAREDRSNLVLDEASDGVGERPREEHQPGRALGQRGIESVLDGQGAEDLVRHRAGQIPLHRWIPSERRDHGDVPIGVGKRASNPDAGDREREEQHREGEQDRHGDAAKAPSLNGAVRAGNGGRIAGLFRRIERSVRHRSPATLGGGPGPGITSLG